MLHADIIEAIAIVKASTRIGPSPKGAAVLKLIDEFAEHGLLGDKIVYDSSLGPMTYGNSFGSAYSPMPRIQINTGFIGDTSATAYILAHEALHRTIHDHMTIDGELMCRAQDAVFGAELNGGIRYMSPASGTMQVADLIGSGLAPEVAKVIANVAVQKSLDHLMTLKQYQPNLGLRWVLANYKSHGGGLCNRDANTLGHFLRVMANGGSLINAPEMVDVLDAILTPVRWAAAKAAIGDLGPVKKALRFVYHSSSLSNRISLCEKRLNERFH